jgi:heat shock protein HslJ
MKLIGLLLASFTLLCGCQKQEPPTPAAGETEAIAPSTAAVTATDSADAANATYLGIYDEPVTLRDGVFEGRPFVEGGASRPRVELVPGFTVTGDLTGDGSEQTVVLLEENSGGSGSFGYLAILAGVGTDRAGVATASLGDRVQIRSAVIEDQELRIQVVETGEDDAACCPSVKALRRWTLEESRLVEGEAEIVGTLSIADLEGLEWRLEQMEGVTELSGDSAVTLVFDAGRIAGQSGCNRYMGAAEAGGMPGEVSFGQTAGTMMACPDPLMQLERTYLDALGQVTRYGFRAGRLVLTSIDGAGDVGHLVFSPHPLAE